MWTRGKVKGGQLFESAGLHLIHGNKEFILKSKVLLLSLASAVSRSRTFAYLQSNVHTECSDHTSHSI